MDHSNHYYYQLMTGAIDWSSDVFKVILMGSGFTFDRDSHATYTDVSGSELSTGSGYTAGGATLTINSVTENDTDDQCDVDIADVTWTASGGTIGPYSGAIIYDDTSSDKTVVAYKSFGGDSSSTDGQTLKLENMAIELKDAA